MSGVRPDYLLGLGILGAILLLTAVLNVFRPTPRLNLGLFKFASLYMLGAMVLMVLA